jgi:FMN reductase
MAGPSDPIARIVVVSAGVSDPSTTRLLAERAGQAAIDAIRSIGRDATAAIIDLAPLAADIARSIVLGTPVEEVRPAIERIATADALVVATPVYQGAPSGLFTSFVNLFDNDLVVATPTILAATAGSPRHAMVPDTHLRPLFAFLRALPVPTSLFAAPDDWADPGFGRRIERAATELAQLVDVRAKDRITDAAWRDYQHRFGGDATRAARGVADVDFDTDLMRLAAGGR